MLVDLVHHVPQFLEHLPPIALAQLLASCVSLRKYVHEHVTKISRAMDCHDVRVLTTGFWPHLTHLELKYCKTLNVQSVFHLAKATHFQLQILNLSYSNIESCLAGVLLSLPYPDLKSLYLAGNNLITSMTHLADARLPLLEKLHLQDSKLGTQSMAALSKGSWLKLKTLTLAGNSINTLGIQYLAGAHWPQLEAINLNVTDLDGSAMVMLVCCKWPCLQILGLNQTRLHRIGELPESSQCSSLKHLHLNASNLTDGSLRQLSKPRWSQLETLDLSNNGLYNISTLVQASWPALRGIRLDGNPLAADFMTHLSKGDWPLLERLYLCR